MLTRKDIRAKVDPDVHTALREICDVEGVEISEFVERLIVREVRECVHRANLISEKTRHLGFVGNRRSKRGSSGSGGE